MGRDGERGHEKGWRKWEAWRGHGVVWSGGRGSRAHSPELIVTHVLILIHVLIVMCILVGGGSHVSTICDTKLESAGLHYTVNYTQHKSRLAKTLATSPTIWLVVWLAFVSCVFYWPRAQQHHFLTIYFDNVSF